MGKYFYKSREDKLKVVEKIFDKEAEDFSYVTNDKRLLYRHKVFINKCRYTPLSPICKLTVPSGRYAGMHPQLFTNFKEFYNSIYTLWLHIIRACLDDTYMFYPYFGGKGILLCNDILDSKLFTLWCLRNGLTGKPFTYTKYLQRKNKSKGYSLGNMFITTEREVHSPKNLSKVINGIRLIKIYEEEHDPSVSYMTFYTRYYLYDMDEFSARSAKYPDIVGFSPTLFYQGVADENSCSFTTFISRMHYSYLNGGHKVYPYDLLNPDYSVMENANSQGKLSYKQQYTRNKKLNDSKYNPYMQSENNAINDSNENTDVYITNSYTDVYS